MWFDLKKKHLFASLFDFDHPLCGIISRLHVLNEHVLNEHESDAE